MSEEEGLQVQKMESQPPNKYKIPTGVLVGFYSCKEGGMVKHNMKNGLILPGASFSKLEPETCCNFDVFVKKMTKWDLN